MKHPASITLILVGLFFASQLLGLFIVEQYIDRSQPGNVTGQELPYGMERPPIEEDYSFLFIIIGVLVGTGIVLLIAKFGKIGLWKVWFFMSATLALAVALSAFLDSLVAFIISIILAFIKVFKQNFYVHNLTELFIYGGLAAIFVPLMSIFAAIMLLVLISIYDAYAVWKSGHMVTLAKFQASAKMFAGLLVPKTDDEPIKKISAKITVPKSSVKRPKSLAEPIVEAPAPQYALLGGGDIAFPLLFSGVVMKYSGFNAWILIIPIFSTLSLFTLLYYGQKGKFYPAMPFLSIGTFLGYGVTLLLQNLI